MKAKKPIKNVSFTCPYCDTKIGKILCVASWGGSMFRIGYCDCGTWKSAEDLNYTGENGIYDQEVPFITYTPKNGDRKVAQPNNRERMR